VTLQDLALLSVGEAKRLEEHSKSMLDISDAENALEAIASPVRERPFI
jgi:hypothetical protein